MEIRKTAPRIKLVIADENNYINHLKWLGFVANDLRNVRNDVMRECIVYLQRQIKGEEIPLKPNGKAMSYEDYVRSNRKTYEHAPATLINWTEYLTVKTFKQYKKQVLTGKSNIPMFRDKSLPIYGRGSKMWEENGTFYIKPPSMNGIVFKMVNPHKSKSLSSILSRVLSGEYRFDFSRIIKDDKFWYLHMSYSFVRDDEHDLDPETICGIDLGWAVPAVCALNNNLSRMFIGDSQLIYRFRIQIKNRRRKIQRNRNTMKAGHGKKRAVQALNHISQREKNFVKSYNHLLSKQIIDFCLKHNAGTIHMESLTKDVKKNTFLTEYWSYYQLQTMVQYKAREQCIEVKFINPRNTSRTCAECGHVSAENRKDQSKFKCIACEHEENADYNAAVNISRSTEFMKTGEIEEDVIDAVETLAI